MAIIVGAQSIPVSEATIATHELVAAVPGKVIEVTGGLLTFGGVNTVKFQSGTTDLTGVMDFGANDQLDLDDKDLRTVAGEPLNMVLSAAVQVSGWITYQLIG